MYNSAADAYSYYLRNYKNLLNHVHMTQSDMKNNSKVVVLGQVERSWQAIFSYLSFPFPPNFHFVSIYMVWVDHHLH
jgi:hypothetical protein